MHGLIIRIILKFDKPFIRYNNAQNENANFSVYFAKGLRQKDTMDTNQQ